ncbi:hypothetical protein [Streptomyces olivaceiscleroticus]|uniref:Uncharacterized protein n=1 Tax=Streptomyces olivaceiscleroticus TaxID=68245 RepID=A0ABN0ZLB8_9ACTN
MLSEAMAGLAAAGGTAVVQAAGTDAWTGFRQRVAHWFGRGNPQREATELDRLDRTAGELQTAATAGPTEMERVRIHQEAAWQARIEVLLENLADAELARAVEELHLLLGSHHPPGSVSAGPGGQAIGGDVGISADHGSAAAWVMRDVTTGNPSQPEPRQG